MAENIILDPEQRAKIANLVNKYPKLVFRTVEVLLQTLVEKEVLTESEATKVIIDGLSKWQKEG